MLCWDPCLDLSKIELAKHVIATMYICDFCWKFSKPWKGRTLDCIFRNAKGCKLHIFRQEFFSEDISAIIGFDPVESEPREFWIVDLSDLPEVRPIFAK